MSFYFVENQSGPFLVLCVYVLQYVVGMNLYEVSASLTQAWNKNTDAAGSSFDECKTSTGVDVDWSIDYNGDASIVSHRRPKTL